MKKSDTYIKLMKEEADERKKRDREIEINPLSQYSTTQLKKELRRRKGRNATNNY